MRELKFNISGQSIKKDSSCDFKNIVRGSNDYLCLVFSFDSEWEGTTKVIEMFDQNNNSYPYLINKNQILVSDEVTKGKWFSFCIHGKKGAVKFKTKNTRVMQV